MLAAAVTLAAPRLLPEARAQDAGLRLDALGAALVTAALVAILYAITRIEHHGVVSGWVGAPLLAGLALMAAFVARCVRGPHQEAVADVDPDERGLASGIFETANHLFGGAVGVALYATLLTATATAGHAHGYRNAFLAGAGLALAGLVVASVSRSHPNATD